MAGVTIGAVIVLILVGGLVRMTGSGMGCPDWPKCFGQWVPPTDVSELPVDYKTRFQVAGKEISDFDAFKTWVEYLNRLVGVLIGFFTLLTAALSLRLRREMPKVTALSVAALFAVIVQGGIGAVVVRTNLHTGMITLHMIIALGINALLIWALLLSYRPLLGPVRGKSLPRKLKALAWAGVGVMLVQIVLGTQVREGVDEVAKAMGEAERASWLAGLGTGYDLHSLFYYVVALMVGLLVWQIRPWLDKIPGTSLLLGGLLFSLVGEIALGLGMHHLGIPAWMQPLHLLGATTLFATAFALAGLFTLYRQVPHHEVDTIENRVATLDV
ncbi:MAG: heme A synthase [Bacteroidetes bacterium]|nr:MAG: heme A synthase [Bacteroidota bacterium]